MELDITDKKDNAVLSRTEVKFKIIHEAGPTPTRKEVRETLSKMLGAPKERVVIDQIRSIFGKGETRGYAKVYESKEEAMKIETVALKKKHGLMPQKKKKEKAEEEEGKEEKEEDEKEKAEEEEGKEEKEEEEGKEEDEKEKAEEEEGKEE